jgi:Icc-related predicted phosphoesterase
MTKITVISDTHNKHNQLKPYLDGGDIILCAGDISGAGRKSEVENFCKWFDGIDNYDTKIFIAGNHDWLFQTDPNLAKEIVYSYNIKYLQDSFIIVNGVKIYGSPWQPEFLSWAFNLPRGQMIATKWAMIPEDTDILITHGPPFGYRDTVKIGSDNSGCVDLLDRVLLVKPKYHIFGHIHGGYGKDNYDGINFINASNLNEGYVFSNLPINFEF